MAMNHRLLRPRASGGGFDPRSISGLELWLDAADQSTLFDADTGGSIVTADAGVGRWMDKSGKGRDFTQDTANNRPLWRAAGRNGRGTLEFDGSNDRLLGDATQYVRPDRAFTFVIVNFVATDSNVYSVLFSAKTNTADNVAFICSTVYTDYSMGSNSSFANTQYTSAARNTWRYVLFDFSGSSALENASYSARAARAPLTQAQAGAYGPTGGAGSAIGSTYNGTLPLKGQASEILMYSKVLNAGERDALENYLHHKWAL